MGRRRWGKGLGEIRGYVGAVAARIQTCQHALAIRAFPNAHVERSALGRLFRRIGAAHRSRRSPDKLLRGKALDSCMGENAGQRSREAEAVREHVLGAGFAEVVAEIFIAVEHMPADRLRRW